MRLTSELRVDAPLERTWAALLDTQPAHGGWHGVLREYGGSVSLDDVDEDEHTAGFYVQGRELRGPGLVSARITAHLSGDGAATRMAVETDLSLTGHADQHDRTALQEATDTLLNRLVAHLVDELPEPAAAASTERPMAGADGRPAADALTDRASRELDLVAVAGKVAERALLVIVGAAIGLAVGRALWGRR